MLTCQLEVPLAVTKAALRKAKASGVLTILNTAPAPADSSVIGGPSIPLRYGCPNVTEAEQLTGVLIRSDDDAVHAARKLVSGASNVVITMGGRGALWYNGASHAAKFFEGTPDKPIDTVGAGDCFVGSLAGILDAQKVSKVDDGLENAIRGASLTSGLSVTRAGTQSSYPSKAEAEQLLYS